MALLDLLRNPDSFPIGRHGHSKNITYLPGNNPKYHLQRVEGWNYNTHDPILDGGKTESTRTTDYIFRGGLKTHTNRVRQDLKRITKFLASHQGAHFILRQGALQLLNPQVNTRTFNAGVSLLAQVAASGISRFKRHGAIPEPASMDINSTIGSSLGDAISESSLGARIEGSQIGSALGITAEGLGNFAENAMGGTYVSMIGNKRREHMFSTGDPGAPVSVSTTDKILGNLNPFKKKPSYGSYSLPTEVKAKLDKINYQTVYKTVDGKPTKENTSLDDKFGNLKDFCNLKFEVINAEQDTYSNVIWFRALLDGFTDNYTATHNEIKYNGRGENFYTYNKFNRSIGINFKIAAQSRHEMKPIYQKLNYLVAQTAPNYSSGGRIRTPYMKLTVGDYFSRIPGVLKSCNVTWQTNYPWEIKVDPINQDKSMKVLPHVLDVSVNFQPIHDFTPDNSLTAAYIGIGEDKEGPNKGLNDWRLAVPPKNVPPDNTPEQEPEEEVKKELIESVSVGDLSMTGVENSITGGTIDVTGVNESDLRLFDDGSVINLQEVINNQIGQ